MDFQGSWWYDVSAGIGNKTDSSSNADMISPAFWLVSGKKFKISRSDDPQHTPLLETTGECLGGRSFRHKMTTSGDFKDRRVWASDRYKGTYMVQYGGQYQTTDGFQQANCNRTLQSANQISFWCDWGDGGGSVMMIGGGGNCSSADHGIGITEENSASFSDSVQFDFGYDAADASFGMSKDYALNLWIR